jgi:hypothetical protein
MVTDATRRWMRELAALRQEAAKLRSRDGADGPARDLLDRAISSPTRFARTLRRVISAA